MTKLLLVPLLFAIACLFAGTYGALHNQISYTVAPEYFTQFKFYQFNIAPALPDRSGAAIAGWCASWWMGILIGIILIPLGLLIPGKLNYFLSMICVFFVVTITTLLVGLIALAASYFIVDVNSIGEITRYNNDIADDAAFMRAGIMHNFSYLGGFGGVITGGIAILWLRGRFEKAPTTKNSAT